MSVDKRKYIRHPLNYPIKTKVVYPHGGQKVVESESENIGEGGLVFRSPHPISPGTELKIEIEVEGRHFVVDSIVVRCRKLQEQNYSIALLFKNRDELLKARMMEQVVRIELFKKRLERRFRKKCEFADVARLWIKRYSKFFANHYK